MLWTHINNLHYWNIMYWVKIEEHEIILQRKIEACKLQNWREEQLLVKYLEIINIADIWDCEPTRLTIVMFLWNVFKL